MSDGVVAAARVIYDYHFLRDSARPADYIVALGTNDLRVAEHAAHLFHQGFARSIVCTGGVAHQGDLLATAWPQAEALMYRDVLLDRGIPEQAIIVEPRATNTAENFRFTRGLIPKATSILVAVKPFMQRRARATIEVEWPGIAHSLSSPDLTLDQYFTPELPPDRIIHILMGDLQRLWIYGRKGWSTPQHFPAEVVDAFHQLAREGWTQHLVPTTDSGPFAV